MEPTTAAPDRTSATTMAEVFRQTVERVPDRVAVRTVDDSVSLTFAQLRDRVDAVAGGLAELEHMITVDGPAGDGVTTLEELERTGAGFDSASAWQAVDRDDTLTLIYTSGTTGPPKGVELSHRNLLAAISTIQDIIDFPDGSKVISWLPSGHVAERNA